MLKCPHLWRDGSLSVALKLSICCAGSSLLDMLRLVRAMLATVGVQGQGLQEWNDSASHGGLSAAFPDTYAYAAGATVTLALCCAACGSAACVDDLSAAMAALASEDAAIVGGANILTGPAARICAAVAQPQLVDAVTCLAATAQALWVCREGVRRRGSWQVRSRLPARSL